MIGKVCRIIALVLIAGLNISAGCFPTAFYVSATGNDTNAGTLAAPFLTLTKAQTAMQGGSTKLTYIRAGTYTPSLVSNCDSNGVTCVLDLQSADSGETWSYYPPDGVRTADITGGSTAAGNGAYYLFSVHTSNITINGLKFHNFQDQGVHSDSGASSPMTITNNEIYNGFHVVATSNSGAIRCFGCANLTVSNNFIHDMAAEAVNVAGTNGTVSNLTVTGNFIQNTCTGLADCAAIYQVDTPQTSTGTVWTGNYIKDGNTFATLGSNVGSAMYADDCTSNVTATGNVITGRNGSNSAMLYHGGKNIVVNNNVVDLGTLAQKIVAYQTSSPCTDMTMSGNTFNHNVVISGGGGGGYVNLSGSPPNGLGVTDNDYYNYAGAAISHTGDYTDSVPSAINPGLNCYAYMFSSTAVFNTPVSFTDLAREWGPLNFVVTQTGTAPSQPHAC